MTIALPGFSKGRLSRIFGRRNKRELPPSVAKPLGPHEVARLFNKAKRGPATTSEKPAKLNDTEKQERETLSSLRGALYSKD